MTKARIQSACRAPRGEYLSRGRAKPGMQGTLVSAFKDLLRPESVKIMRITHVEGDVVNGFLLTHCPVGDRDHWKDFEAHLVSGEGTVSYAVVDGRKLAPTATRRSHRARN